MPPALVLRGAMLADSIPLASEAQHNRLPRGGCRGREKEDGAHAMSIRNCRTAAAYNVIVTREKGGIERIHNGVERND